MEPNFAPRKTGFQKSTTKEKRSGEAECLGETIGLAAGQPSKGTTCSLVASGRECELLDALGVLALDGGVHLMTEWLYRQAGQLIVPDPALWLKIVNPELWDPLKAFDSNLERVRQFWSIQPSLVERAVVNVQKLCNETWKVTGKPELMYGQKDSPLSAYILKRIIDDFDRRYKETNSKDIAAGYDFERALDRFEHFIKVDWDFEREVFGIFLSQIVMTWTAFETLASELWAAIILCEPQAVAKPDDHSFQKLSKIQDAYAALLPRSREVDAILTQVELRQLNLVRNVALHKAGRIDQKFLSGAKLIAWDTQDELDAPIQLDGARVKNLINPVIQAGIDLLQAVDRWIVTERRARKNP